MVILDSDSTTSSTLTGGDSNGIIINNGDNGGLMAASQAGSSRPLISSTRNSSNYTPLRKPIDRASSTRIHYIGRPGSRRYQRYLNRSFLLENERNITPQDLLVFSQITTPLSMVLQDSNHLKNWEPFISTSEEKQEHMLKKLTNGSEHNTNKSNARRMSSSSASDSFALIDLKIRKLFKKSGVLECEIFDNLEKEITCFILGNDNDNNNSTSLTYSFDSTYQRMLCHGICQYYRLESRSQSVDDDNDVDHKIVIVKKKHESCIPNETLSTHLQTIQRR